MFIYIIINRKSLKVKNTFELARVMIRPKISNEITVYWLFLVQIGKENDNEKEVFFFLKKGENAWDWSENESS